METFDILKGALVAYAAFQARDYLSQLLPGFGRHYDETAQRRQGGSHFGQHQPGERSQQFYGGSSSSQSGHDRSSQDERTESALGRDRSHEAASQYGVGGGQSSGQSERGQKGETYSSGSSAGSAQSGSRHGSGGTGSYGTGGHAHGGNQTGGQSGSSTGEQRGSA
jgi:hypothetical protein